MAITFEQALQTGTGAGVRIGILDTGIAGLPHLRNHLGGHYQVVDENDQISIVENQTGFDDVNHGTAIADIIHRYAPEATLFDMKVMDFRSLNSRYKIGAGIRFGTGQGWDILNICVGTQRDYTRLREVTDDAIRDGLMIISAIDCEAEKVGFPAEYPDVIGVDYDLFDSPLGFGFTENADICGHGIYIDAINAGGNTESYTGSSFACPHITALAARARQFFPNLTSQEFLDKLKSITPVIPAS